MIIMDYIFLITFGVCIVYGNDKTASTTNDTWKNAAITSLFLLVIMSSILVYVIGMNRRLKRRANSLEKILIDHGITKEKPYHYALSSDDEYDELNPFLAKSEIENEDEAIIKKTGKKHNDTDNDDEYDDLDQNKSYQQVDNSIF